MGFQQDGSGKRKPVGGFNDGSDPGSGGASIATAPVRQVVATETAKTKLERIYTGLPPYYRITNRASKGHREGKPFLTSVAGERLPADADPEDPSTWLQPGDSMVVNLDAMLGMCGSIFDPLLPDKEEIIRKYGDWEYEGVPEAGMTGRKPAMRIIGPPLELPDLVIEGLNQRMMPVGEAVSLFDKYVGNNVRYHKPRAGYEREVREELLSC